MIINIKNKDIKDDTPLNLTSVEFWNLFLTLRNDKQLTKKEIEVFSEHLGGSPKEHKGNYKKYVDKLKEKNLVLEPRKYPKQVTLQIKINVT